MNFRTKEHYENSISKLLAHGEFMNQCLSNKLKRQLRKIS